MRTQGEGLTAGHRLLLALVGFMLGLAMSGCRADFDCDNYGGCDEAGSTTGEGGTSSSDTSSSASTGSTGSADETGGTDGGTDGDTGSSDETGSGTSDGTTTGDETGGTTGGGVCLTQGNQCNVVIPDPPCCEGLVCSYTGSFTTCQPE
jgi:hypothetical protein